MSVCDKEQIFLFPGERLVETICHKNIRFQVVERAEFVWCGTLGYYGSKSCYAYCAVEKK